MTTQPQSRPGWMEVLDRNRQNVSYALLGVGGALLIAAAILMWKYGWPQAPLIVGFLLFGLTSLGCGLWFQGAATAGLSGQDSARLLALIVGGMFGLSVTVGAIWQTYLWWNYVAGGTEVWQGEGWQYIWVLAALFLVGLAVMFFSLLLGRSEESDNPTLRRLLYGYNAVLTGLLVLGILAALNVLAYLYLPVSSDWTKAGIYTLSNQSEMTLKELKQPVTVYVLEAQRGDLFDTEMRDLMDNARAVTDKIQAEYLIRDINRERLKELKRQYNPDDDRGLIVVYGSGDNAPHTFIPEREVLPLPPFDRSGRAGEQKFKGEDRLMSAIRALEEGTKPVIYFTQGNGELDLFGTNPATPPERQGQALVASLERRGNYEVKGLLLAGKGGKALSNPRIVVRETVPEDAAVVIIAGPTQPLSPEAIDALKKYMRETHKEKDPVNPEKDRQRKGKLMVLADVVAENDRMKPLNFDKLLSEYDVDVTNERVLRIDPRHPFDGREAELVHVTPNPDLKGRNPLATLFQGRAVLMNDVRVIRPHSAPHPGEGPRYQAVELLVTVHTISSGYFVMAESDLRPPAQVLKRYEKNEDELEGKARVSLPVGVSVSEAGEFNPMDPHTRAEGAPRVEVIGDATFVSDKSLGGEGEGARINYELFASALAWLRERPGSMGLEPKDRGSYTMKQNPNFVAMMLFPFGLMSLSIMGIGLGVWVVRRR